MKKIFLTLLAGILFSCQQENIDSKRIRLSLPSEPPTLDWNIATDGVSYQILNQLMEGLTQYDNDLKVIPAIAQSWDISTDGKVYTFHINPAYHWSDGKNVTAQDFYDSWIRLLKPETASEYAYFLFDVVGAKDFNAGKGNENSLGLKVVDNLTFEVTLDKSLVYFPALTTFMVTFPIRKDIIEQWGSHWTEPEHLISCGAFILDEWWHEYRLRLKPNPHYGGNPKPTLNEVLFYIVSDPATSLFLYEANHLDVSPIPALALERFRNKDDFISIPKLRGYYLGFNTKKKPLDDIQVRQALASSLDKSLLPQILRGGETPVDSWVPPGMFGYNPNIGLKLQQKHGSVANEPITLAFNSDAANKKIAEWAQAQWKKNLGVDVQLSTMEWKSYLAELNNNPPPIFRLGWGADYPDPDNFLNLFTSYSGNNHTGWHDDEYDRLIKEGSSESDSVKRQQIYDRAQTILLEEQAVIIPLFVPRQNILVRSSFRPYPLLPLDFVYLKRVGVTPPVPLLN